MQAVLGIPTCLVKSTRHLKYWMIIIRPAKNKTRKNKTINEYHDSVQGKADDQEHTCGLRENEDSQQRWLRQPRACRACEEWPSAYAEALTSSILRVGRGAWCGTSGLLAMRPADRPASALKSRFRLVGSKTTSMVTPINFDTSSEPKKCKGPICWLDKAVP